MNKYFTWSYWASSFTNEEAQNKNSVQQTAEFLETATYINSDQHHDNFIALIKSVGTDYENPLISVFIQQQKIKEDQFLRDNIEAFKDKIFHAFERPGMDVSYELQLRQEEKLAKDHYRFYQETNRSSVLENKIRFVLRNEASILEKSSPQLDPDMITIPLSLMQANQDFGKSPDKEEAKIHKTSFDFRYNADLLVPEHPLKEQHERRLRHSSPRSPSLLINDDTYVVYEQTYDKILTSFRDFVAERKNFDLKNSQDTTSFKTLSLQ